MQEFIHAYQAQDWDKLDAAVTQITRRYIDGQDHQGLVLFWKNFLKEQSTEEEYAYITGLVKDMGGFQSDIAQLLRQGVEKLQTDDNIKAFYYEYQYDGSEWSSGNLFLCSDFDTRNGGWASNFEDLVNGREIARYFDNGDVIDMGSIIYTIARHYAHSVLLNAFIGEIKNYPLTIPVGFADHDNNYRMVAIMPNGKQTVICDHQQDAYRAP